MHQAVLRDQRVSEADEVFLENPLPAVRRYHFGILCGAVKKALHGRARVAHCDGLLLDTLGK